MCQQPIIRLANNRSIRWILQDSIFEEYDRLVPLEMADLSRDLDNFYSPETQALPSHLANTHWNLSVGPWGTNNGFFVSCVTINIPGQKQKYFFVSEVRMVY